MSRAARRWPSPALWLVLALPFATIVGGIATLRLVAGDLSINGASEGVRRTAQVQTAELAPDLAAARRALAAELHIEPGSGRVRIRLAGDAGANELRLELEHSLHAERDLSTRLRRRGDVWIGALPATDGDRWRLLLSDADHEWRLVGALPRGARAASLRPALAAP